MQKRFSEEHAQMFVQTITFTGPTVVLWWAYFMPLVPAFSTHGLMWSQGIWSQGKWPSWQKSVKLQQLQINIHPSLLSLGNRLSHEEQTYQRKHLPWKRILMRSKGCRISVDMKPPPTPATICRKCIMMGDVWLGAFCDKVLFGDMADVIAGLDRSGVAVVISNKVVCKFSKHLLNTALITHS